MQCMYSETKENIEFDDIRREKSKWNLYYRSPRAYKFFFKSINNNQTNYPFQ